MFSSITILNVKKLLAVITMLVLSACGGAGDSTNNSENVIDNKVISQITLESRPVEKQFHADILRFHGVIKGGESYNETIFESGKIASLKVKEGQILRKGDVVAELYSPDLAEKLTQAKTRLNQSLAQLLLDKESLERNKVLLEKGLLARQSFDQSKRDYDSAVAAKKEAEAGVTLAENGFEDTKIIAKNNSIVSQIFKREGDFVSRGEAIFRFELSDKQKVSFSLPERLAVQVGIGDELDVIVPSLSLKTKAKVIEKALPTSDDIRLHDITLEINNADPKLIGLRAELNFESNQRLAYKVDYRAIKYNDKNQPYIIQTGSTLTPKSVSILSMTNEHILVTGQLNEGAPILIGNEVTLPLNLYKLKGE